MDHRKAVVFCVIASNLTTFLPAFLEELLSLRQMDGATLAMWAGLNSIYYGLLIAAGWLPGRKAVAGVLIACLVYMSAAYLVLQ